MNVVEEIVALGLLASAAIVGGYLAGRLRMPPLLGMLLAGLALRNLGGAAIEALPDSWSLGLRLLALAVILLRAGLGLDLDALRRLRGAFLRLAFLPNLAEAGAVAVAARVLFDLPAAWGLLLGFVVAAVSPAVVVPSLLDLQARGYGVDKGIPTMVLAAASFDDVLSITGFGLALSLVFEQGRNSGLAFNLLRAPAELLLGIGGGVLLGLVGVALTRSRSSLRFPVVAGMACAAIFGGWATELTGGGSLAVMTMGAVVARRSSDSAVPLAQQLSVVWRVAQPLLFGLIGAAVALDAVEPRYVTRGLVLLSFGMVIRLIVSYGSVAGGQFTLRERLFVAVAWVPKATVQAAVGALALDVARQIGAGPRAEMYGSLVLTIAVLAIVVTAPLGAMGIAWAGPRWLEQRQEDSLTANPEGTD